MAIEIFIFFFLLWFVLHFCLFVRLSCPATFIDGEKGHLSKIRWGIKIDTASTDKSCFKKSQTYKIIIQWSYCPTCVWES